MEIGNKLKLLRNSYGLTQTEFAKKLEISRVNYTRYENNKVRPDYETLIKIADFYDITLDELFDRK
ncbi:MAG: helix-turn-helix transcriptional regulator [Clostridia bacterium]|nr:helix-turn-helix transcriptional regulator [Clostridia bacterium]